MAFLLSILGIIAINVIGFYILQIKSLQAVRIKRKPKKNVL